MTDLKYTVLDESSSVQTSMIRIDEGDYNGVVYHYNTIKFLNEAGDSIRAEIDVTVDSIPDCLNECSTSINDVAESEAFKQVVGDIAMHIICARLDQSLSNEPAPSDT